MKELLALLSTTLAFLVEDGWFRITDSNFHGRRAATVVLESNELMLLLAREDDETWVDVGFKAGGSPTQKHTLGTVRRHVEGGRHPDKLDSSGVEFLRTNLSQLEDRARQPAERKDVLGRLADVAAERARERRGS